MGWVGSGHTKWTHGQLWRTASRCKRRWDDGDGTVLCFPLIGLPTSEKIITQVCLFAMARWVDCVKPQNAFILQEEVEGVVKLQYFLEYVSNFNRHIYGKYAVSKQDAQRSPSDRAMRLVSSNLANYHATVQKLLIRQVLAKLTVWSWRFSWRQCVINKPTTVLLCISPVYRRLAVAKFF